MDRQVLQVQEVQDPQDPQGPQDLLVQEVRDLVARQEARVLVDRVVPLELVLQGLRVHRVPADPQEVQDHLVRRVRLDLRVLKV